MGDVPASGEERALWDAAYNGDLEGVKSALGSGMNIDAAARGFYLLGMHQNYTALMCAADQGHLEIVRLLLEAGASVSAITDLPKSQGGSGTQALHFAGRSGHEAIVAALLDAGADVNAQAADGRTPLVAALSNGELNCATLLLERGAVANPQSRRKDFAYPLVVLSRLMANTSSLVSRNGKLQSEAEVLWEEKEHVLRLYRQLLQAGADPTKTDQLENTPLNFLAGRIPDEVRLPIVRLLLDHGASANAARSDGDSVLMRAADQQSVRVAEMLLERGADVNRVGPRGTALDVATSSLATLEGYQIRNEAAIASAREMLELLRQRGGLTRSELGVTVEPPAARPEPVHIATEFLKLVNTTEAEWALFAVKAPLDAVLAPYQKFAKLRKHQSHVPIRLSADGEEVPPLTAVVQVKGSPWTIVLCTIFYVRATHVKHIKAAAIELSRALATPVVTYAGTAETEYGRCELFENGESTARAGSSKAVAFLTKHDVALPACYPARKDGETWLAVETASLAMVERADLLGK